jgi:hypothetical protein
MNTKLKLGKAQSNESQLMAHYNTVSKAAQKTSKQRA